MKIGKGDGVDRLCKVVRPVYGMAQAGRRWQRTLFPWLLEWKHGDAQLMQATSDPCIFHCHTHTDRAGVRREEWLFVGCYVDDLFVLSSHTDEQSLYAQFTRDLAARWDVEDEGEVSDLLNIEITPESDGHICLRQVGYIDKLMRRYAPDGVAEFGSVSVKRSAQQSSRPPCGPELSQLVTEALTQDAQHVNEDLLKAYQSIVGALLYCAVNTRPDVAFAVGMLCRAMGKPTVELLKAAYRVLFYLDAHKTLGLRYSATRVDLAGMSDADWATRHSTSGYVFHLAQAAISWGSKRQHCVALSSCEAEIVALSEAAKEGVYLTRALAEFGFTSTEPTTLATDNKAARDLAYNPEHHDKTKHIERRHFFIREMVESEVLVVPYVPTEANMADFFTKALPPADFFRHRRSIMNMG